MRARFLNRMAGVALVIGALSAGSARADATSSADAVPAQGAVERDTGPFLYLGTGFSIADQQDTRINDPTRPPQTLPVLDGVDFDVEYQDAAIAEIGLGYRVMRHLRVEANVNYRNHTVENVQYRPNRGDFHFVAGMANVYVDYPIGRQIERGDIPILMPYLGGGVGVLWSKARAEVGLPDRKIRGESAEFAWNLMVGTAIPITRRVALDVGYRYLESFDHRWLLRNGGSAAGDVDGAYLAHEGRVGLRIGY